MCCIDWNLAHAPLTICNAQLCVFLIISVTFSQNWIDPKKPLLKYVTKDERQSCKLQFRVKFYVTDPSQLQEECTRHQFYLQIRRDIFHGNVECPPSTQCLLASYTVQGMFDVCMCHSRSAQNENCFSFRFTAELGDYDALTHEPGYLKALKLIPNQTDEMEFCINEHHKLHRNQSAAEAEHSYLEHATKLEMYGIYFYKSKDSTGKDIELGITTIGVIVYQNDHIVNEFSWSKMLKISFKRRTFFMELKRELVRRMMEAKMQMTAEYFLIRISIIFF